LNDATARQYVDGAAFHLYAGDISALMQIHSAYPTKNVYFTEQYTASSGSFSGDLKWHLKM
jgi:glucosylceramidase